jgi:hypothetical protein
MVPLVIALSQKPAASAGETAAKTLAALLASKPGKTVYVSKAMAADATKAAAWLAGKS